MVMIDNIYTLVLVIRFSREQTGWTVMDYWLRYWVSDHEKSPHYRQDCWAPVRGPQLSVKNLDIQIQ